MFFKEELSSAKIIIPLCRNHKIEGILLLKKIDKLSREAYDHIQNKLGITLSDIQDRDPEGNLKISFTKTLNFENAYRFYGEKLATTFVAIKRKNECGKLEIKGSLSQEVEYEYTVFSCKIKTEPSNAQQEPELSNTNNFPPVCSIS